MPTNTILQTIRLIVFASFAIFSSLAHVINIDFYEI
jgi:hypothetical protein